MTKKKIDKEENTKPFSAMIAVGYDQKHYTNLKDIFECVLKSDNSDDVKKVALVTVQETYVCKDITIQNCHLDGTSKTVNINTEEILED